MEIQDRQYIGILASDEEVDGRNNVFINKGSYIQYRVKSLLLPQESASFASGFISSFEDDLEINDDEYSTEEERVENFKNAVKDQLFIYSYKVNDAGHANLSARKTNMVKKPLKFSDETFFMQYLYFAQKTMIYCVSGKRKRVGDFFENTMINKNLLNICEIRKV